MKKPKIVDEKALECAEILKEYCKSHELCSEGCVFHNSNSYSYYGCKLDDGNNPKHWELKEEEK